MIKRYQPCKTNFGWLPKDTVAGEIVDDDGLSTDMRLSSEPLAHAMNLAHERSGADELADALIVALLVVTDDPRANRTLAKNYGETVLTKYGYRK